MEKYPNTTHLEQDTAPASPNVTQHRELRSAQNMHLARDGIRMRFNHISCYALVVVVLVVFVAVVVVVGFLLIYIEHSAHTRQTIVWPVTTTTITLHRLQIP